jgi:tRNA 2-selenouridine synthase
LYKAEGSQLAVAQGLEILAGKCEPFLKALMGQATPQKEIVVYCWRGGMRSTLVAKLLRAVGFSPILLKGGYKQFRKQVLGLIDTFAEHPKLVLNGRTGSGKTEFLSEVLEAGLPAVDFEGLAAHRGSAFGGMAQARPSPTQQNFENHIAAVYLKIRHHPTILVELENFIGPVYLPQSLRKSLTLAPMIFVKRGMPQRVAHIVDVYFRDWTVQAETMFINNLDLLKNKFVCEQKSRVKS